MTEHASARGAALQPRVAPGGPPADASGDADRAVEAAERAVEKARAQLEGAQDALRVAKAQRKDA